MEVVCKCASNHLLTYYFLATRFTCVLSRSSIIVEWKGKEEEGQNRFPGTDNQFHGYLITSDTRATATQQPQPPPSFIHGASMQGPSIPIDVVVVVKVNQLVRF